MLVQLTMRRRLPGRPDNSPVDGIRILALLPDQWRKELRRAGRDVVIRIAADDAANADEIRAEVVRILKDPAIDQWELVDCVPLVEGGRTPSGSDTKDRGK